MISNDTVEFLAEFGIRLDGDDLVVPGARLDLRDIRLANVARITTAAEEFVALVLGLMANCYRQSSERQTDSTWPIS